MLSIIFTLAAGASSPSGAIATPASGTVVVAEAKPQKPKKICRPVENLTGSRISKSICKTKEQWEQGESAMELGQKSGRGNLNPADALGKQSPGALGNLAPGANNLPGG